MLIEKLYFKLPTMCFKFALSAKCFRFAVHTMDTVINFLIISYVKLYTKIHPLNREIYNYIRTFNINYYLKHFSIFHTNIL